MGPSGRATIEAVFGEIQVYQQPGKGESDRVHVGMHGGICEKAAASDTDDYGASPSMDGDLE